MKTAKTLVKKSTRKAQAKARVPLERGALRLWLNTLKVGQSVPVPEAYSLPSVRVAACLMQNGDNPKLFKVQKTELLGDGTRRTMPQPIVTRLRRPKGD